MTTKKQLSSSLTFSYKYILPLIFIGFVIFVNLTIDKETNSRHIIPMNLSLLVLFLIAYLPLKGLKKVEYNANSLITSNYIETETFRLKDVVSVKRWLFYFYKISIYNGDKIRIIYFLAPARDRIFRPFTKLTSIIEFEKRIQKSK